MGPKKGSGPKGGGKKQPQEISIDDFVAAGDTKGKGKAKAAASPAKGTPGKKDAGKKDSTQGNESEEPKKPSVKSIIGGASWTGKLPVNMLSEHCQKQRWEKPEYTM
ncbi:hypothetical protein KEM55_007829, partial [Ascosphaera atra]